MNQHNNNMVPIAPAMPSAGSSSPTQNPTIDIQRKKRTRAKRSCDMCRKKKTRCDADISQPCTKCKLANVDCLFLVEQKKRGPSTGSYVEALENRLLRMEKLLKDITKKDQPGIGGEEEEEELFNTVCPNNVLRVPEDDDDQMGSSGTDEEAEIQNDADGAFGPFASCQAVNNCPIPEEEQLDEIQQKLKLMTISNYQRTRYIGASSGLHFLNKELFRTHKKHRIPQEPSWFIQKLNDDVDEHVIMKTKEVPPPPDDTTKQFQSNRIAIFEDTPYMTQELADYLVHMYFTRVHIYCPIINKTQFLEQYYFHQPTPPDKYMLYAIACIGTALFIPDISLIHHLNFTVEQLQEMYFHIRSKVNKLVSIVYRRSMISTVQTLMLLSMFVGHDDNDEEDTSHWFITGMAIRMAQDLGLHRDCSKWDIPDYEIELRQRIWYAAYLMDRWVAAELGRPVSILDNEFDVQLPTPYELPIPEDKKRSHNELTPILILEAEAALEEKKPVYIAFLHLVTMSQIAGQVLVGFHSTRAKHNRGKEDNLQLLQILDQKLTNWKLNLPKELELDIHNVSASFNAPACVVNMAYDCMCILLYRPFIKQHDIDQSADVNNMSFKALSICTASAINLVSIAEAMEHRSFTALPWNMAVYIIFQAAIIFLHNARGENVFIREQGYKYFRRCARVYNHDQYLRKTRVIKVLQELVKQFEINMEEETSSMTSSQKSTSTSTPPSIGHRRKRDSGRGGGEGEVSPSLKYTSSKYGHSGNVDDEEQARHNAFVKNIMATDNVYLPTNAQKHARTENGIYTVSRGNTDQGGQLIPDPYPTSFNISTSSASEDIFHSSLSFGIGKDTMNALLSMQQQQKEEVEKKRKMQQEAEAAAAAAAMQQAQAQAVQYIGNVACEEAAAALARGELVIDPILCPSQQQNQQRQSGGGGKVDPLICPSSAGADYMHSNHTTNSFSTSCNTTPEADCCPSMHMEDQQMNYHAPKSAGTAVTDQTQQQQQFYHRLPPHQQQHQQPQQFDIASLQSDLPLWELPSGVTWHEWESFLKLSTSNTTAHHSGSGSGGGNN